MPANSHLATATGTPGTGSEESAATMRLLQIGQVQQYSIPEETESQSAGTSLSALARIIQELKLLVKLPSH